MFNQKLIVFSAPSGSGKTTLVKHLLSCSELCLGFSISATSRPPREGEIDGQAYYFISPTVFKKKILQNAFIEYEEVYTDQYYGTLWTELGRLANEKKHVIFDIDVIGGLRIKELYPEQTLSVFVRAPSIEELKHRLEGRDTESEDMITMRLDKVEKELAYATQFDYIIENNILEHAKTKAYELVNQYLSL